MDYLGKMSNNELRQLSLTAHLPRYLDIQAVLLYQFLPFSCYNQLISPIVSNMTVQINKNNIPF